MLEERGTVERSVVSDNLLCSFKMSIPEIKTSYMCKPYKLPDFGGKKHIVRVSLPWYDNTLL
jgi:hypothetical protein